MNLDSAFFRELASAAMSRATDEFHSEVGEPAALRIQVRFRPSAKSWLDFAEQAKFMAERLRACEDASKPKADIAGGCQANVEAAKECMVPSGPTLEEECERFSSRTIPLVGNLPRHIHEQLEVPRPPKTGIPRNNPFVSDDETK